MVDQTRFEQAEAAYRGQDWHAAAQGFLAAAQDGGEGSARAYVKAGTALSRMGRWADAAAVYRRALTHPEYAANGAVWVNLGAALLETADYEGSLAAYDTALEDPAYATRWRALQGRAGALACLGRHAESAASYREAALASDNPDPGKALNNLALQFMELDRPEDAVEAYRAALELDGYVGRARASANLGIAYQQLGLHHKAVESFAAAEAGGFALSGRFAETRVAAVADDSSAPTPAPQPEPAPESPATPAAQETVGDPQTGEIATAGGAAAEAPALAAGTEGGPEAVPAGDSRLDTDFFDLTDDDMRRIDREKREEDRAQPRTRRGLWSAIAATVLVFALLAGLVAAALLTGFGWPTQTGVVTGMLAAYKAGQPVDQYWISAAPADIDKEMARIPPTFQKAGVGAVKNTSLTAAVASVAVTIENGSPLDYVVSLQREGVGWRVAGIENDFRSTSGTP